jgi:hypothetical protein
MAHAAPRVEYEQVRQRLIGNPADIDAWLSMSRLVDGPAQEECLKRAALLMQTAQTAQKLPPLDAPAPTPAAQVDPAPVPAGPTPRRIGEWLIARGAITSAQLDAALQEQRKRRSMGVLVPIGDILVQRRMVMPRVLAETLVEMHKERLSGVESAPFLLGEYLLDAGVITDQQLVIILEEQIIESQAGRYTRIGEILIRRGILTQDDLDAFLRRQSADRSPAQ